MSEYLLPDDTIRFIKFDNLVSLGTFPRCPDFMHLTCTLETIDRDNTLMIFISHCWLRGHPDTEGWSGKPHPDNTNNEKYELCMKGIKKLWEINAPQMKNCCVWLDYSCMNQNSKNISGQLEQYQKIVEVCDCMFTPIVDHGYKRRLDRLRTLTDYKAKSWKEGPQAYLNRGWCRVEMLYAAHIPLRDNTNGGKRRSFFKGGLAYHCSQNRRPHFVYGNGESAEDRFPSILPPLQCNYLTEYDPLKGKLSRPLVDLPNIVALLEQLSPYMEANKVKVGYTGDLSEKGEKNGYGTLVGEWGDVYDGEWSNGLRHGLGILRYSNGDMYDGEWENDKMNGMGTYRSANGDVYRGGWKNNSKNGLGTRTMANGSIHDEEWTEGKKNGRSFIREASGLEYHCEYKDDNLVGRMKVKLPNGQVFEADSHDILNRIGVNSAVSRLDSSFLEIQRMDDSCQAVEAPVRNIQDSADETQDGRPSHTDIWNLLQQHPALRELRHGDDDFEFKRPACYEATTIWYRYCLESKTWFWTPYVSRFSTDWIPVSEMTVPRGSYAGEMPAIENQRIILYLQSLNLE